MATSNNVAGVSSNILHHQLSSFVTSNATSACFNPPDLHTLNTTVTFVLGDISNYAMCEAQGLVYNALMGVCYFTETVPKCGSTIVGLDVHASAACGAGTGNTSLGSTCEATCNQGYTSGHVSATFVCEIDGVWNGSLSCQG